MPEKKYSSVLSFMIGGLVGSGIVLLLTQYLTRKRNSKAIKTKRAKMPWDEIEEQIYEDGVYCAPEGADMHYDMEEEDQYYSNGQ